MAHSSTVACKVLDMRTKEGKRAKTISKGLNRILEDLADLELSTV